ncbi:hypothetical protein [Aeoliella sp.]|uniref:hypothetical protein n=1 Tax=Aeoliella sp. TaxID=2795800 RepID=UPI003CCC22EB
MKSYVVAALAVAVLGVGLLSVNVAPAPSSSHTVAGNYYLNNRTQNFYKKKPQRVRYKSYRTSHHRFWRG